MKRFVGIYIGTKERMARWRQLDEATRKERESKGMSAWMDWGTKHASAIVDQGGPLGKTKRISSEGISDIKNDIAGYIVVQAESHEAAAKLFESHPHFTIFPGDSVEIMELLPIPAR
jgi:hypothetical protein